jgi:signal transduction histidine kinase/ActR/RegA family two-component response regulator
MPIEMIKRQTADEKNVARFHVRNIIAICLILAVLISSFLILLAMQYQKSEKLADEILLHSFKDQVNHLDSLLTKILAHLNDMQILAQADLLETRPKTSLDFPAAYNCLENNPAGYFHMDHPLSPDIKKMMGNLTGQGSFHAQDLNFQREMRMALNLNPLFYSTRESIKTSAWVYYISSKKFINLYPWVPSDEWKFTLESYGKEFYTLGLPEKNPLRKPFWTRLYVDEVGIGLMTTCGIPVYDGEKFLGTIAIDLTVDFLNTIVTSFRSDRGELFLINAENQLLAHPKLTTSNSRTIKTLSDATPTSIQELHKILSQMSSFSLRQQNGYRLIQADLQNAPWKVIYLEPVPSLVNTLEDHIGLGVIVIMSLLLGLVVIILFITHFFYILPSEKLVNFILDRSRGKLSGLTISFPQMWKTWFASVDKTFEENERLTQEIRHHSEYLEERVKERTLDLEKLNEQLRLEIIERKDAETEKEKTEQKTRKLEMQLRQVQKMEAIGTLAGGIAHDFNNILGAIIGYTELAGMDAADDPAQQKKLKEVLRAADRAKDLIKQILTFSRRTEPEFKPVQVKAIAQETLELIRASLPATIRIDSDLQSDDVIQGDPTQIHQMLMNLCTNAGQAMEKKGGVLSIDLNNVEIDTTLAMAYPELIPGPYLKLIIKDTGEGIPPETMERIFEPFFTTKAQGEGTGMGLAVVHGIIQSHKGTISVQSKLGEGSVFSVFLPRIVHPPDTAPVAEMTDLPRGSEHILFVDDEETLIDVGKAILESLGYTVTTTSSSEKALTFFKFNPDAFDLVITDMTMPQMTGDKLTEELLQIRPNLPIIICTGYNRRISEEKARQIGAKGFLMKPLLLQDMAIMIRTLLDGSSAL